jgi:hypothetical protein
MRELAWLWMLVPLGCTAPNPAYEDSGAGQTDIGGSETGLVVTVGTVASTDGSGEPVDCELHVERPLTIARLDPLGASIDPDCSGADPYILLPIGRIITSVAEGKFTHTDCDTDECPCPSATGPESVIQLAGDMLFETEVPLPLPDCGRVALWPKMGPEGCEWAGVILYRGVTFLPQYIASRTLEVTPLNLGAGPLTLELRGDPCTGVAESCVPYAPGAYGLGVYDHTVTVESSPDYDVYVEFVMGGQPERYYIDNRMSSVTRECEPLVAWTAQYFPPPT